MNGNELKESLTILSRGRVFFGHQSVGKNIIAGIEDLSKETDCRSVNIIELPIQNSLPSSYFLHKRVGKNLDPTSKCDAFKESIDEQSGKFDVAVLKFCYVDISRNTDVGAMFDYYKKTIEAVRQKFPRIVIVHTTIPLMSNFGGDPSIRIKLPLLIKRALGIMGASDADNIKRNEYNELVRRAYCDEPIIDIARTESTNFSGKRATFRIHGKTYYAMFDEYTNDGGHLNEIGRKRVAAEFLKILAGILEKSASAPKKKVK